MRQTKAWTIKEAYLENIRKVLTYGIDYVDERGNNTRELLNLQTNISSTIVTKSPQYLKGSIWNGDKLQEYCEQMNNGEDKGFVYDYGNRLRGFDVDQISTIVEKLKENKMSRRATAVTWRPVVDAEAKEVPCLIMIDFKIRGNTLHTSAVWRSHDIYGAYYANLQGLKHIAKYIAKELDVNAEVYNVYSLSAHIHEMDFEASKNILKENGIHVPARVKYWILQKI